METMERKRPGPRRAFSDEFKADIIERCLKGDRSIAAVAHDFDLTVSAVRGWVKQAEIDAGLEGRCKRRWRSITELHRAVFSYIEGWSTPAGSTVPSGT